MPLTQDDGRAHHRREARARTRRLREVELAEHVVEVDAGAGDDRRRSPRRSTTSARRRSLAVDDGDVRRAAARRSRRASSSARARPLTEPAAMRAFACSRITRASASIASAVPGISRAELLQERQAVGDQDPARRGRRIREVLLAAEGRAHGSSADDAVLLEVSLRDAAAVRRGRVRRSLRRARLRRAPCRPCSAISSSVSGEVVSGTACLRRRDARRLPSRTRRATRACGAGSGRGSRAGTPVRC